MNAWQVGSLVCTLIGLLLLLVALSTDYWVELGYNHAGLWKNCVRDFCVNWTSVGAHIDFTRIFLILGTLDGFASTGFLCALFFRAQIGSFNVTKNATAFNFSAGFGNLIAMSVFTGVENAGSLFSWSFALGWACCPLFFIAGGLAYKLHLSNAPA